MEYLIFCTWLIFFNRIVNIAANDSISFYFMFSVLVYVFMSVCLPITYHHVFLSHSLLYWFCFYLASPKAEFYIENTLFMQFIMNMVSTPSSPSTFFHFPTLPIRCLLSLFLENKQENKKTHINKNKGKTRKKEVCETYIQTHTDIHTYHHNRQNCKP